MATMFANDAERSHRTNLDVPMRQAKVHTVAHKKLALEEYRAEVGRCIERARCLSELTAEQFADEVGCHPSTLSKWIHNIEPPQTDRVLMSPMRPFMLQALAERTQGCEVASVITLRRRA
jgi:DNA-binding transcriptional regulator YiaG